MKIIAFILSIIIVILSSMTCAEVEEMTTFEKSTVNNSSNHQHEKNACSPLCVCNCFNCQGFNLNEICSWSFVFSKTLIDKKIPDYKSILSSNYLGSIWQPPQINSVIL